ncbi:hypothetical protein PAPHI01_2584, partial [Pancytospora philotis]
MRLLTTALSLAGSFVFTRISLRDAINIVESERATTGDDKLFVSPEGPLNILRGHAEVNNNAIAKKRMFSPPIHASYSLEEMKSGASNSPNEPLPSLEARDDFKYKRDPKADDIWVCTRSRKLDYYLRAYYSALKVLFRITNGKVVVSTNHHKSFYKYTRDQFASDNERARFFAALLLLANGEKGIGAEYRKEMVGKRAQRHEKITGVALTGGKGTLADLSFEIPNMLSVKKTLYIEEVRTVVNFFVEHGASNVGEYGLDFTDSPSFLIQAYLCEYANDSVFIGEVFGCVDAFLREIYAGTELDAARDRYFTTDDKLVKEYSEQYDAFRQIDKINSRCLFPFNRSNMPLDTQTVHYCDKVTGKISDADSYGDCAEIALFNFFCCMLYDPKTRKYSIGHLEANECSPTEQFKHFFTKVCTRPEDNTKACVHQEWARVVQGITQPQAANRSSGAAGEGKRSLIIYTKMANKTVPIALEADIGTFLMALAEIVGLPAAKKDNLEDMVVSLQGRTASDIDRVKLSQSFNDVANTVLSIRSVNLEFRRMQFIVNEEREKILSGFLSMSFPPQKDDQSRYEILFGFDSSLKHVEATYVPQDVRLNEDDRKFFAPYGKEAVDGRGRLIFGLMRDSVRRFLSRIERTLAQNDHIADVESAHDPKTLYIALSRWLCCAPMRSYEDRLAAIDQLLPTFIQRLKQWKAASGAVSEQSGSSAIQNRAEGTSIDSKGMLASAADPVLSPRNPLVLLIANILGSVPLNDAGTRECFLRAVLTNSVCDCAELFPSICIHSSLYRPELDLSARYYGEKFLWEWSGFRVPNLALDYLRQIAASVPKSGVADNDKAPVAGIVKHFDNVGTVAYKIVDMFMTHRHTGGVEFLRDYCLASSGGDVWRRMAKRTIWFYMGAKNQVYSEVHW